MILKPKMSNPIAVIIADVHYDLHTLELADKAVNIAIETANNFNVPLIVAGDLHNTKASMRAECVNAMIATFKKASLKPYVLIGNHDLLNEKAKAHSLEFLRPYATVVDNPIYQEPFGYMIPYQTNIDDLINLLQEIPEGSQIIMHQGVQDSNAGEYFVDKTALPAACFDGFRVISGHYHTRQTIRCGKTGVFDYVGNPYTLTYAESQDPAKGIRVLLSDSGLDFLPLNLRTHRVYELTSNDTFRVPYNKGDLLQVKIKDTYEKVANLKRADVARQLGLPLDGWKLTVEIVDPKPTEVQPTSDRAAMLDSMIVELPVSNEQKERLKNLWRKLKN